MNGSWMKKFSARVFCARNGSMKAVATSGSSSMSDSWIAWNPRIEEPSKARPSVKTLSSNDSTGRLKCCITPGRSQNRTSTNFTSSSLRYRRSSSGLANTRPPGTVRLRRGVAWLGWRDAMADGVARACPDCFRRVTSLGERDRDHPSSAIAYATCRVVLRSTESRRGVPWPAMARIPPIADPRRQLDPTAFDAAVASARRFGALMIDWVLCLLVASLFADPVRDRLAAGAGADRWSTASSSACSDRRRAWR